MQAFQTVLLVIHLIVALLLIGVILLQRSEGGALGIGGGGGSGGNIFSARGVGNTLTRTTAILAVCFFLTSMGLTILALRGGSGGGSIFNTQQPSAPTQETAPSAPSAPAPEGGSVLPQLQPQAPAPAPAQPPQ
jgi:preprotein translocase subunit SecG